MSNKNHYLCSLSSFYHQTTKDLLKCLNTIFKLKNNVELRKVNCMTLLIVFYYIIEQPTQSSEFSLHKCILTKTKYPLNDKTPAIL